MTAEIREHSDYEFGVWSQEAEFQFGSHDLKAMSHSKVFPQILVSLSIK